MKHVDDRALVRFQLVFVGFVFLVDSSAALRTLFYRNNSNLGSNSLGKSDVFYDAPEVRSWCYLNIFRG